MNTPTSPVDWAEFWKTTEQDLVEAMNDAWKPPGIILGTKSILRIYNARLDMSNSKSPIPHKSVDRMTDLDKNTTWLYNIFSGIIEEVRKTIEGDICRVSNMVEFLDMCATASQLHGMKFSRIVRLLRTAEPVTAYLSESNPWVRSNDPLSDLFDREWNILIFHFRERVERIAWEIHVGQHVELKPGGEEWRNIEKFYGGLGQRVTMTRLKIPALLVPAPYLRKVYVAIRPVDASERNHWKTRRKETKKRDSGTAGIIKAASCYVPVPCQHWALLVEEDNTSAIWELGVVEGRIKIDRNVQYYPDPSHRMLVGYTAMSNDGISASAEDVRKCMDDMYSFSTFNCQLFCSMLFQSIRFSHTMSDAFSDLHALPDDHVVSIVTQRLQQLSTIACVDPCEVENLQPMPIFFGTLYIRALVVATSLVLLYIFINLGVTFFFLVAGVVVAWSPFAQRHTYLYPLSAKRDLDQKRLHYLYFADKNRKENASGQCVAHSIGSQQELFRQSGRIVEIDDEDDMNSGLDQAVTNLNRGYSAR